MWHVADGDILLSYGNVLLVVCQQATHRPAACSAALIQYQEECCQEPGNHWQASEHGRAQQNILQCASSTRTRRS